jgi:cellulose synthase (UDP-forming)
MNELHTWAPLLFTVGLLLIAFEVLGRHSRNARAFGAMVCIACSLRYLYWRIYFTAPLHQNLAQTIWSRFFLCIESSALISAMLVYFFMSRFIDRRAIADRRQNSPLIHAPVDVFIATYNEGREILERTMVGAKAIDHSDLRVWILDDGARPWVRDLADELGVMYVQRVKGKHAKAGNVNNGLKEALSVGRPPEFILLLDADFVPHRHILRRVLGLFEESDVGIVQTPQHFFNPDPVQSNLLCATVWPDEQRFFFNVLMPCKDAWGAAFCCGTSAVIRTAALQACGGMATETVTEDMLTTFKMGEYGYRTIYLNERLSLGLAPESLGEFMSQRSRWCLGAMQQIFTRWSFFGRARLSLINRIAFFDSVLYWVSGASFKLMLISAPMLFWFTGTSVLRASVPELTYWMAPMVIGNFIFMGFLTGNRILPVMTDMTQVLTVFVIGRTVLTSLVRPFGHAFKVTAKGLSTSGITIQWHMLWRFALLGALTVIGMMLRIARFSPFHGRPGYSLNVFWSLINAFILALASAVCVELPKRRSSERFATSEAARILLSDGSAIHCRLGDISLGGARLVLSGGASDFSGAAKLSLDGGRLEVPFETVRRQDDFLAVQFRPDVKVRRALIVKLFTGAYHQDVEVISAPGVFKSLAKTLAS